MVGEAVVVKDIGLLDFPVDAADDQVHHGQAPGGVVELLAVDADLGPGAAAVAVTRSVDLDFCDVTPRPYFVKILAGKSRLRLGWTGLSAWVRV